MTKIDKDILKIVKVLIFLDLCLVIYIFIYKDNICIFITIGSYLSYKKNIEKRLSSMDINEISKKEDRDKIDEIDDPFDLYSEYEQSEQKDLTPQEIKEIIQEEKSKLQKNSFKNTIFSASGFLSIYRFLGYGSLILGFFALNNNKVFMAIPFILGISVVPLSVLLSKLLKK